MAKKKEELNQEMDSDSLEAFHAKYSELNRAEKRRYHELLVKGLSRKEAVEKAKEE